MKKQTEQNLLQADLTIKFINEIIKHCKNTNSNLNIIRPLTLEKEQLKSQKEHLEYESLENFTTFSILKDYLNNKINFDGCIAGFSLQY